MEGIVKVVLWLATSALLFWLIGPLGGAAGVLGFFPAYEFITDGYPFRGWRRRGRRSRRAS